MCTALPSSTGTVSRNAVRFEPLPEKTVINRSSDQPLEKKKPRNDAVQLTFLVGFLKQNQAGFYTIHYIILNTNGEQWTPLPVFPEYRLHVPNPPFASLPCLRVVDAKSLDAFEF